ncbi:prepilin peptidase [Patescibacteria group bacterium]|nr:prepilin peptidase [Patescibacteria group bacterium]MBU1123288.1 prepilin peptidase [Patescibacteria group bacterium]
MYLTDPLVLLTFLLGLVFGSFANVLIVRLPKRKRISGRSACPKCGVTLQPLELIPVVSFFLQGGKCRTCKASISVLYPAIELISGFLFVFTLYLLEGKIFLAFSLFITLWLLLIISLIDAKTKLIPDILNIPFVAFALVTALLTGSITFLAPVIAVGFFLIQWIASRGRWVGSGDIILAAGIGFLMGDWQRTVLAIGVSYVIGGIFAGYLLLTGKQNRRGQLPFGPFLAVGAVIVLVWGEGLLRVLLG